MSSPQESDGPEHTSRNDSPRAARRSNPFTPKPGIKSTELWVTLTAGGAIFEILMQEGGPSTEQAIGCIALSLVAAGYVFARTFAKRIPQA